MNVRIFVCARMRPEERAAHDDLVEKVYSAVEAHVGCCFMDNEGSGLFFLQSHLNHSCQPNAVVEFPFNRYQRSRAVVVFLFLCLLSPKLIMLL